MSESCLEIKANRSKIVIGNALQGADMTLVGHGFDAIFAIGKLVQSNDTAPAPRALAWLASSAFLGFPRLATVYRPPFLVQVVSRRQAVSAMSQISRAWPTIWAKPLWRKLMPSKSCFHFQFSGRHFELQYSRALTPEVQRHRQCLVGLYAVDSGLVINVCLNLDISLISRTIWELHSTSCLQSAILNSGSWQRRNCQHKLCWSKIAT